MKKLNPKKNKIQAISIAIFVSSLILFLVYGDYKGASSLSEYLDVLLNDTRNVFYFIFIIVIQPFVFLAGRATSLKIRKIFEERNGNIK